jgi:DnaJ family protein C protein 7
MDIDPEPPASNGTSNGTSTPPPAASAQTNFAVPIPNGTTHDQEEAAPAPPPHKSNPSSPQPTPADEAEAYKAAGNRFFKEKNYTKAIEQYSKGIYFDALTCYGLAMTNTRLQLSTSSPILQLS